MARCGTLDIQTSRLSFYRHTLDDYDECAAMWSDPETNRYLGGKPSTPEESWARLLNSIGHWAALRYGFWVIRDRDTGRFAGNVGFRQFRRDLDPVSNLLPEIGWILAPWARGHGLATEAALAALGWADAQHGWPDIICMIEHGNLASDRVAFKCGFFELAEASYKDKPVTISRRSRPAQAE